jgi:hypothetical protein
MSDGIIRWHGGDILSLIKKSCCSSTGTCVSLPMAQSQFLLRISIFCNHPID